VDPVGEPVVDRLRQELGSDARLGERVVVLASFFPTRSREPPLDRLVRDGDPERRGALLEPGAVDEQPQQGLPRRRPVGERLALAPRLLLEMLHGLLELLARDDAAADMRDNPLVAAAARPATGGGRHEHGRRPGRQDPDSHLLNVTSNGAVASTSA
jgi:hypothetical protein